ncbi:Crp/Fnr family transcriptional regulator [Oscillatoriales cyanobacterium LEGE 11467]|uniref:Crp/Fnr family transcriptional regulator n=1 Tax=Zarconia navalis LEGE 11467 TaxID=1828826 RepID=A0A928Z6M1_9CYAN|nr:Crp/Fnr family transcriptional regulator [Zarconia navalis]MBE9040522.1 Crp/Fnr family transcriptional regulator [Zarconia navalis LEGE 11467]
MQSGATPLDTALPIFPFLANTAPQTKEAFCRQSQYLKLSAGQFICLEGDVCHHLALVLSGTARVYKMGNSGREITLYRIESGESCILTASCILSQQRFPAFAVAETAVEAIGISASRLRDWMTQDPTWQRYIFGLLSGRLTTVIEVVEEVAFHRMDVRISAYLLKMADSSGLPVQTTHEGIAQELGSSREVISRILKDLEKRGIVHLTRGNISILKLNELIKIARGSCNPSFR